MNIKQTQSVAIVVLAAGRGTRMKSKVPKVLHPILGKPMIWHTARLIQRLRLKPYFVVGIGGRRAKKTLEDFNDITFISQPKQLGTADAVKQALKAISSKYTSILVLHGDSSAFFQPSTLQGLINRHFSAKVSLSILTLKKFHSDGSGVIIRNRQGEVIRNIETKYKTYNNCEVNVGAFVYNLGWLRKNINLLEKDDQSGEYCLADIIELAARQRKKIITVPLKRAWEKTHVNTLEQLKRAEKLAQKYLIDRRSS